MARDSPPDEVFPTLVQKVTSVIYHYRTQIQSGDPAMSDFFVFGGSSLSAPVAGHSFAARFGSR